MEQRLLTIILACATSVCAASGQEPRSKSSSGGKGLDAVFDSSGSSKKPARTEEGRAWWGVKTQTRPLRLEGESPIPAAEVVELKPGSAAARAGLQPGDLIVGVQLQPLKSGGDLDRAISAVQPGGSLSLQVIRDGNPLEIIVVRGGQSSRSGPGSAALQGAISPTVEGGQGGSHTGIFINEREITPSQVQQLRATYGYVAPPGRYWYDAASGLYGVIGREAAGFMQPGHDFGRLPANASNGTTGVFINGRQINMVEAMYCRQLFGAVYQGRWWLDGRTGNLGAEGSPVPIANVYMALQQSQRSAQGGGSYGWHSKITGASGGSDGKCSYVSIPGSGSVMTGNCD